jgi:hypothetical protein
MRITKKYSGASCIGKQVFQACVLTEQNIESMKGNFILIFIFLFYLFHYQKLYIYLYYQ